MLLIRPQSSTSRRDFEPHGPEGTRAISSSARSVSNYHSFKYVPNECHSFKYVPNECPMTTRGKECPYVPDEKWAMCPSCGDSLSRLGIAKNRTLPHHQK